MEGPYTFNPCVKGLLPYKFEASRLYKCGASCLMNLGRVVLGQDQDQDQVQDSLLVKRRNDNYSPGPVIRELVPP